MLVYEYVYFRCMIEDKCICVCLIPALISFVYVHGAVFPAVLMCSSRPLRWLRDGDVTEWYQSSELQQWASMGQEEPTDRGASSSAQLNQWETVKM